jgi:hypothetical protein
MQYDWYRLYGKLDYLKQQKSYLISLLDLLSSQVDEQGSEQLDPKGMRFLDWPSYHNAQAVHAGLQAMLVMAFEKGSALCKLLGEPVKANGYQALATRMRAVVPDANGSKEAASLLSLSGMMDARKASNDIIGVDGPKGFSAFFGYYMLQAQAKADDYTGALNMIRQFWGGMLDLGATTFWEEFDLEEAANAAPIDNFVPAGKKDYHKETGIECYIGLRRSLCHGWSTGPTAWLSEHVLGIEVLEAGCRKIRVAPHLGDLAWAEGTFPTPFGALYVKHTRTAGGKVVSEIKAPKGIVIIRG